MSFASPKLIALLYNLCFCLEYRLILVLAHGWLIRLVVILDGTCNCSRHVVQILLKPLHGISVGVFMSQSLRKLFAASVAIPDTAIQPELSLAFPPRVPPGHQFAYNPCDV